MAGVWIKAREDLRTHPKFLSLCAYFTTGAGRGGMAAYILQSCNENVTLSNVTKVTFRYSALHDVTWGGVHRVWGAVNLHCKVVGSDAVMPSMRVTDIDEIAGIRGFGEAMQLVAWVRSIEPNSLLFPNFLEFNEPACSRRKPLTSAERVRRHRSKLSSGTPIADGTKKISGTPIALINSEKSKNKEENTPLPLIDENEATPPPAKTRRPKTPTISEAHREAATRVVDAYVEAVGSSHPRTAQADRNVSLWLSEGVAETELTYSARNYAEYCRARGTDPAYRKKPSNFFGRTDPAWRNFATGGTHERPQDPKVIAPPRAESASVKPTLRDRIALLDTPDNAPRFAPGERKPP